MFSILLDKKTIYYRFEKRFFPAPPALASSSTAFPRETRSVPLSAQGLSGVVVCRAAAGSPRAETRRRRSAEGAEPAAPPARSRSAAGLGSRSCPRSRVRTCRSSGALATPRARPCAGPRAPTPVPRPAPETEGSTAWPVCGNPEDALHQDVCEDSLKEATAELGTEGTRDGRREPSDEVACVGGVAGAPRTLQAARRAREQRWGRGAGAGAGPLRARIPG